MKLKDKILITLLTIFTLGLIWLYWNKKKTKPKNELSVSKKVEVNLEQLILLLNGVKNIESVNSTHTKVKINLKENNNIDILKLKELKGISGVVASSKSITIIVGNSAKTIQELLEEKLK